MRSRFDVTVAVTVAVAVGIVAFFLAGMVVIVSSTLLAPFLGPVLVSAAALGAVWLVVRRGPSAKGFGTGMLVGWALLAFWSSRMSIGYFG